MKIQWIFPAMAAGMISLSLSLAPAIATAGGEIDQNKARELVASGQILSLTEIIAHNNVCSGGRLLDVELEKEDGQLIYEIEVLMDSGEVREYEINAKNGELLKEKVEKD